jgi:hypothetical protein
MAIVAGGANWELSCWWGHTSPPEVTDDGGWPPRYYVSEHRIRRPARRLQRRIYNVPDEEAFIIKGGFIQIRRYLFITGTFDSINAMHTPNGKLQMDACRRL